MMASGRLFQTWAAATGKVRLPTVETREFDGWHDSDGPNLNATGAGANHGHRQHVQNIWRGSETWFSRYASGQTLYSHHNTLHPSREGGEEMKPYQLFLVPRRAPFNFCTGSVHSGKRKAMDWSIFPSDCLSVCPVVLKLMWLWLTCSAQRGQRTSLPSCSRVDTLAITLTPEGVHSIVISVSVCLSVCLAAHKSSKRHRRTSPYVYVCWRLFDMLCTSGFVDDVVFHTMGPIWRVVCISKLWKQLKLPHRLQLNCSMIKMYALVLYLHLLLIVGYTPGRILLSTIGFFLFSVHWHRCQSFNEPGHPTSRGEKLIY